MAKWLADSLHILAALVLVFVNGFFVAAEFALVKVRESRLDEMVRKRRPFAGTARWLMKRLDASLSACQLGITMASLGLGWIGEPALARLLRPVLLGIGLQSEILIHAVAFTIAFTAITAGHLVLGEQAPKIFAIRRPEPVLLWFALPLKIFYFISYPFMVSLNATTRVILRLAGIGSASDHEKAHSEEEIRALLSQSQQQGELTRSEHRLLNAIFEFDDLVCRQIMIPRNDIVFMEVNQPLSECIKLAKRTKHSRYPVCQTSLDKVVGVVHIKDLIGVSTEESVGVRTIMRPPHFVPETIPVSRLMRQMQATHQHMAFVMDEYGTVIGTVTLENVIEQIVGSVEDEFDIADPEIVPDGPDQYIVHGSTPLEHISKELNIHIESEDVDTFSGALTEKAGRILKPGDQMELAGAAAEVLEVKGSRAVRIRVTLTESS